MIEERNTRNSFFDTEIKDYTNNSVAEAGALMFEMGRLYYGDGNLFQLVTNSNDLPYNAYEIVIDESHESEAGAQILSVAAQKIENDGSTITGTLTEYNSENQMFYFERNVIYNITINFNAQAASVTTHAQIFFGFTNSLVYNQNSVLLNFAFQANVAHAYSATFQIVGNSDTEQNGLGLYINPSATGKLWNAKYTIQRFGYNLENV